jgi:hypothetical protein
MGKLIYSVVGGGKRFFPDNARLDLVLARGAPVRKRRAHPAVRRPRGCSWASSGLKASTILWLDKVCSGRAPGHLVDISLGEAAGPLNPGRWPS